MKNQVSLPLVALVLTLVISIITTGVMYERRLTAIETHLIGNERRLVAIEAQMVELNRKFDTVTEALQKMFAEHVAQYGHSVTIERTATLRHDLEMLVTRVAVLEKKP